MIPPAGLLATSFIVAVCFAVYILVAAFVLWMLVDAGKQDKFWWVVIILGLPVVGAIGYFFLEKERDYAKIPVSLPAVPTEGQKTV